MPAGVVERYVSKLEKPCGEKDEFVVFLKRELVNESLGKVLARSAVKQELAGFYFKCVFEGKEISAFTDGRLLIKDVKSQDEVEEVLEKLLGDSPSPTSCA